MSQLYVAKDGNDANNGSSWALAKLTVQAAVTAAASGDTINIASGLYSENITTTGGKVLTFLGVGYVVLEAPSGLGFIFSNGSGALNVTCQNLIFRNAAGAIVGIQNTSDSADVVSCRFDGISTHGVSHQSAGSMNITLFKCSFFGVSNAIFPRGGATNIRKCTFVDCANPINNSGAPNPVNSILDCIFYSVAAVTRWHPGAATCDGNVYSAIDATHPVGVTFTSLASWQATGKDARAAIDAAPFIDKTLGIYHLPTTSTHLRRGVDFGHSGAYPAAHVLSPNTNAATWNAPFASAGLAQDGSGYWVGAGAYVSQVIDLTMNRMVRRLMPIFAMTPPAHVLDYAIADAAPRQWTFRWRASVNAFAAGDPTPAWTESSLTQDVLAVHRYVQYEYTLRTDGV